MQNLHPFSIMTTTIGLIISLAALFISIRASNTGRKAYELANRAFRGERRGLLTTRRDNGRILLEPFPSGVGINKLLLVFPTDLKLQSIELAAPHLHFFESRILNEVTNFWDERTPGEYDHAIVRRGSSGSIPIIITVHSYSKGEATQFSALYDLRTTYTRTHKDNEFVSNTTIDGIEFHAPIDEESDPTALLDVLLGELQAYPDSAYAPRSNDGEVAEESR